MVLEVLSYSWQVHHSGHTNVIEEAACTDSRDLENLRRVERASSHDSFAVHTDRGLLSIRRCRKLFSLSALPLKAPTEDNGTNANAYLNSRDHSCAIGVLNNKLCDRLACDDVQVGAVLDRVIVGLSR